MGASNPKPLRPSRIGRLSWFTALLLICLIASPAFGDDLGELAARLIQLRGDVDTLAADLEERKAQTRDQLRSLARQKADLESQIQREQLRIRQLRQSLDVQRDRLAATSDVDTRLTPLVLKAVQALRAAIQGGLPFKESDRLKELADIEQKLNAGTMQPSRALARLWAFVEDELRLTRESGLYRQTIVLDGNEVLADVARVGMVMLFFKTSDERVGMALLQGGDWTYEITTDNRAREQILAFFDSLKKQIRQGYFTLPNALRSAEVAR